MHAPSGATDASMTSDEPSFGAEESASTTVASDASTPESFEDGSRTSSATGVHAVRAAAKTATNRRSTAKGYPSANRNERSRYFRGVVSKPEPQPPRSTGPSDAALVVAARAGESWAREALFRRYARMVFGLAYRLMGRDQDIDDLVQECFAQALAHLWRLAEPQAFGAWLTSIVVRTAHKTLRRRALATRLGLRVRGEPVDIDSLVAENAPPDVVAELRAVYSVIDKLPVRARTALILRRVEGMSQEEVAAAMEISVSTAKRAIIEAEVFLENELRIVPARRVP
jgi:RNA polymerase sigma-70 factor (ECF subfamily)